MRKILIDTDIGDDIDDALALGYALRSPELEVVALTTVFRHAERRANIARAVLHAAGRDDIPVYPGCDRPLIQDYPLTEPERYDAGGGFVPCQYVSEFDAHRRDGMPHAVQAIVEAARAYGEALELVAIGPLTNIAMALRLVPELSRLVAGLTIMGGDFTRPFPEWNIRCDPEAARIVFASGLRVRAVGLNVTERCVLSGEAMERLARGDTPLTALLASLVSRWSGQPCGSTRSVLHDPLTIGTLIDDRFVRFEEKAVRVALSHEAGAGCTLMVADAAQSGPGTGMVQVAMEVDSQRYLADFIERICRK